MAREIPMISERGWGLQINAIAEQLSDQMQTADWGARWVPEEIEVLLSRVWSVLFNRNHARKEKMTFMVRALVGEWDEQVAKAYRIGGSPEAGADAKRVVLNFISRLPEVQKSVQADVDGAMRGDPAAKSELEVVHTYPSIVALYYHRVAHVLYSLDVPILPRLIAEIAHSKTGIDIHPGAKIGARCFIDHGTGVVIGETAVVGSNVRIYQGVTLGAKSFPKSADGSLIKGQARHPIVEDDVTIYAGANILGRIKIGAGSVIGGNVWITEDIPPRSRILQNKYRKDDMLGHGDGI